jgi:hypothetical protein
MQLSHLQLSHLMKGRQCSRRRLQAGRRKPFAHVGTGFRLSRPADQIVARGAGLKRLRFRAQARGLFGETPFQRVDLFETATLLHRAAPFRQGRRERDRRSHHR